MMRYLILFLFMLPVLAQSQCLKGNCENGHGTYRFEDGSTFEGEFINGRIGNEGILYFANGDKYLGQWKDQKRHGKGKMVFATGDVYVGEFRENLFSGYGEITYLEGDVYKGEWEYNLPNGEGTMYYANGRVESGYFVDGGLEGRAVESDLGTTYESEYFDDTPAVPVEEKPSSVKQTQKPRFDEDDEWDDDFEALAKERNEREWAEQNESQQIDQTMPDVVRMMEPNTTDRPEEDDRRVSSAIGSDPELLAEKEKVLRDCNEATCHNEEGYYTYNDGSRFEGFFVNGEPEGRGVCYYANGDKYVGHWQDHAPHGDGIMYFDNGKVFGAVWDHGQPVGELKARESLELVQDIYTEKDDEIKVWAVVVGVSRYTHMPVLKYSDDDAYRIYAFLKSPEGGALPDEQIRVLIDEDATREKILKMLQHTLLRADDNDVVMVYFSGHGLEGSFVPIDFDGYSNLIAHQEVIDILNASKARYKMCFADACHSGGLTAQKGVANVENTIKRFYDAYLDVRGGTAFMLSSKSEEFSLEDGGLRQGVFSHFLIRGMKGEADVDFNNVVTIGELFKFVHFEVRRYTGNVQTPVMLGRYDRKMPVSVTREY